jgi:hypothetical protein
MSAFLFTCSTGTRRGMIENPGDEIATPVPHRRRRLVCPRGRAEERV